MDTLRDLGPEARDHCEGQESMVVGTTAEAVARLEGEVVDLSRRSHPARRKTGTLLCVAGLRVEKEVEFREVRFPRRYWAHVPNRKERCVGG